MDFEKVGINKDTPITTDSRTHVKPPIEPDLQQFTEQQINDYCEKIDNICFAAHSDGKLLFEGMQIIRQLQAELAAAGMVKMGFKIE